MDLCILNAYNVKMVIGQKTVTVFQIDVKFSISTEIIVKSVTLSFNWGLSLVS